MSLLIEEYGDGFLLSEHDFSYLYLNLSLLVLRPAVSTLYAVDITIVVSEVLSVDGSYYGYQTN